MPIGSFSYCASCKYQYDDFSTNVRILDSCSKVWDDESVYENGDLRKGLVCPYYEARKMKKIYTVVVELVETEIPEDAWVKKDELMINGLVLKELNWEIDHNSPAVFNLHHFEDYTDAEDYRDEIDVSK